jgi:hypothetical protein
MLRVPLIPFFLLSLQIISRLKFTIPENALFGGNAAFFTRCSSRVYQKTTPIARGSIDLLKRNSPYSTGDLQMGSTILQKQFISLFICAVNREFQDIFMV